MAELTGKIFRWLDERLPVGALRDTATHKTVPVHRWTVFYYLGGMTLFFFLVQVVTGILLMLYYRPSADTAFESVEFIMTTVPFGWLIRSIHSWSANLMVFFAFLHLATVFFMKAYRKPREVTWVTGVLLLFLTMGFGFSGYLLPWNELAFFATKVGTDIAGSVPVVGEVMLRFLRGGDHVTGGTLSRFYGWHVAILPALTTLLLVFHVIFVQIQGMSVPPTERERAEKRRPMRFFPDFMLRDLFGWTLALAVLATLAALFPWELGEKADPFSPAPRNIRPEWYFMFMFQSLKLVPGGEVAGIEFEAFPILFFGLAGFALLLVPFLDRGVVKRGTSPLFTAVGGLALVYIVAMTAWGYHSLVPVWVVILTVVLLYVLRLGTRHGGTAVVLLLLLAAPAVAAPQEEAAAPQEAQATTGPAEATVSSCVTCHRDPEWVGEEMAATIEGFDHDVHTEVGLGCADCHGGNPDPALAEDMFGAMDPTYEDNPYRGAPERTAIPEFCGTCHSDPAYMKQFKPDARVDQVSEYWTSRHGERLREGDTQVATCVDCHGVHGIRRADDPESSVYPTEVAETCRTCHGDAERMADYTIDGERPLPVDQYERWRRSVHAAAMFEREDLSAPTCNDCHGNHGAAPPGLESITFVCGQCHGREAELFRSSAKQAGFEEHNELMLPGSEGCADCHAEPEPQAEMTGVSEFSECATCHGNHAVVRPTVALLGPLPETPCAFCHEAPDGLSSAYEEREETVESYEERRAALLAEAERQGLAGTERFDWLVDMAQQLDVHTQGMEGESRLRPEFARLFEKFRIGKTRFTYPDPSGEGEITDTVTRCTDCHGEESLMGEPRGYETSRAMVEQMHELTVLIARAERILLAAQRGGVAVREVEAELDQAIDAQIELEALVHTFSVAEGGQFAERHTTGIELAHSAVSSGQDALAELAYRRRGLAVSLALVVLVLVGLGLKIRQQGRQAETEPTQH